MEQSSHGRRESSEFVAVSKALSAIYTGVFLIRLENDSYTKIKVEEPVEVILDGIESAQQAINMAIQSTVSQEGILDMLSFVNLMTLPQRMQKEKILNTEYMGSLSGWVRGSFIEVERNDKGVLTQVLYAYQAIDEDKRKELDHLQKLKDDYASTEKRTASLEADNKVLSDDLKYQNDFLDIVLQQVDCGIMAYTVPGRHLLQINKEALRTRGWKDFAEASEKFGSNQENITFVNEEDKKKLRRLQESETAIRYQFVIDKGEKNEKHFLAESKSLAGRYGGKVIISTFMDITHVLNLEADKITLTDEKSVLTSENTELQRARDAVQTILKSGSYLCAYAEDGETLTRIEFSDALRKLYGYSGMEDAPNTWATWLSGAHPEDREYVEKRYYEALKDRTGNTDYDVTFRALRKDGTMCWHRAAAYIIRRADGTAEFSYGLIMDVDAQKKAEDRVKEALRQAEIANAAKSSFLARMSHDIRTPMNGILGLIEINERHSKDVEFTARNRKKAKVAAEHLLSLINDVLQLSKMEDPVVELSHEPFNLLELTEEILIIIEQRAKEKGIKVRREDDPGIYDYPYVYGSPLHVKQIFINILSNSIKYNKDNGNIFCSGAMERKDENHVVFKVDIRDTGIGMSEEFLQRMFEPFAREQEETEGASEGTGLGMSIVKQLLEKMNGKIQVSSEPGVGSCFNIEIPFELATKDEVENTAEESLPKDIHGRHILLVEDNELNMDIAEIILSDAGAQTTQAVNGQQAVDIFEKNSPGTFDAILMDVMMPVMNGYEASKKIRALDRPDAKEIPIIAITANAFTEDVERALKAGMNDHLAKPLNIQKMIATIAKYTKK